MILGTEARVRPMVELVERSTDIDLSQQIWPAAREHRDRGRFLTPRLYPVAPFDPWQPVSSYIVPVDRDEPDYAVASESM